jgi:hypothetical protein
MVQLVAVFCYLQIVYCCCLLVGYAITLRHNLKGPKFPLLIQLICLLMLSNVGSMGCAFGTIEIYINKTESQFFFWIVGICFAV